MPDRKDLEESLSFIGQLFNLVKTNQEIAVMRIGHLRKSVVAQRELSEGLADVYRNVHGAYNIYLEQQKKVQRKGNAYVLLSTNERLAGPITTVTARHFIEQAGSAKGDIIIVGKIGLDRFRAAFPDRNVISFDLPTKDVQLIDLAPLLKQLLRYKDLFIFYPSFKNVVRQIPVSQALGAATADDTARQGAAKKGAGKKSKKEERPIIRYIFEPNLEDIVDFFNSQLFGLIVQQLFTEADLALIGSRITSLENAADAIALEDERLRRERLKYMHRLRNKKQRERLAGMRLWRA